MQLYDGLKFERTADYGLLRSILTHPKVYPWIGDDHAPAVDQFRPVEDPRFWYVLAWDGDELLGCFIALPVSSVCWEIHCCLLPGAWGSRSARAARGCFQFLFDHTTARRITGSIPAFNRLCVALARRSGMEIYGSNPRSFLKWGTLHDQLLFGISASTNHQG